MQKVLIDTGFIVALFNERDPYHEQANLVIEKINDFNWYTTVFVFQEMFYLINKNNRKNGIKFLETFQDLLIMPELPRNWMFLITEIIKKYSEIDVADASLVVLANQLETHYVVSVDKRNFSRLKNHVGEGYFENLFFQ